MLICLLLTLTGRLTLMVVLIVIIILVAVSLRVELPLVVVFRWVFLLLLPYRSYLTVNDVIKIVSRFWLGRWNGWKLWIGHMKLVDLVVTCKNVIYQALHKVPVTLAQVLEVAHMPLMLTAVIVFSVKDLFIFLSNYVYMSVFIFFIPHVRSWI